MYGAECKGCGWESEPAETKEAAAGAGLMHLATAHAHALQAGDVSLVRVWTFDTLKAAVRQLDVTPEAKPEPEAETPPAHAGHTAKAHHERAKEPEKRRH